MGKREASRHRKQSRDEPAPLSIAGATAGKVTEITMKYRVVMPSRLASSLIRMLETLVGAAFLFITLA